MNPVSFRSSSLRFRIHVALDRQKTSVETLRIAAAIAGFRMNRDASARKLFFNPVGNFFCDPVGIFDRHVGIDFHMKLYKANASGLAGSQIVEAVNIMAVAPDQLVNPGLFLFR